MDKLFNILVFLLPFVVESVLVKNDLHILRKKILGRNIYDRHVKPDGKIDVSFGIDIMDMNFCPHKHVNNISLFSPAIHPAKTPTAPVVLKSIVMTVSLFM